MPKTKKVKRKQRALKTRRRSMRGGYYGAAGPLAPGAMEWKQGSEVGPFVANRGGNVQAGGKRRRKMKGGGSFGAVSAGFVGTGHRGLGNVVPVNTKGPPHHGSAQHGAFNDMAAGRGFKSFGGLLPK